MLQKSLSQSNPVEILSVEDNDDDFNLIKIYIQDRFNNISLRRSEKITEIYEYLDQTETDILLLDLVVEGNKITTEYISEIKEKYKNIQIVVISGNEDIRIALDCINKGAQYILKGDNLELELIKSLSTAIHLINSRKEVSFLQNLLFKDESFKSVLYKNSKDQSKILVFKDFEKFPYHIDEPLDIFLLRLYTYISIGIGQGEAYNTGVVLLPSATNYNLLVYSFSKDSDQKSTENQIDYYQYIIFIPNHLIQYLPKLQFLESIFLKLFLSYEIDKMKPEDFDNVKKSILTYLKENFNIK